MLDLFVNVLAPSLISSVAWGFGPYFDKQALTLLNNKYQLVFLLKFIFGGFGALILFLIFNNKLKIDIYNQENKKAIGLILLSSISSLMLGHYFFYKALSKSKYTSLVVLISYVLPLIVISILSYFMLNEKINRGMVFGMMVCIVGISIFVYFSK